MLSFTNTLYIIIFTKWSSYMGSLPDHSWPHSHASHNCPAACLSPWVLVVLNVGSYLYWKRGEGRRERVKGMEGGRGWWEQNVDSCNCVMSIQQRHAPYILVADGTANGNEGAVGLMLWVVFPSTGVQPVAHSTVRVLHQNIHCDTCQCNM